MSKRKLFYELAFLAFKFHISKVRNTANYSLGFRKLLMEVFLRLTVTFCSLAKWRKSKHKCSVLYKSSIEELPLNLALNPPFCQAAVTCCCYSLLSRKIQSNH